MANEYKSEKIFNLGRGNRRIDIRNEDIGNGGKYAKNMILTCHEDWVEDDGWGGDRYEPESANFYLNIEDIDPLIEALQKAKQIMELFPNDYNTSEVRNGNLVYFNPSHDDDDY